MNGKVIQVRILFFLSIFNLQDVERANRTLSTSLRCVAEARCLG